MRAFGAGRTPGGRSMALHRRETGEEDLYGPQFFQGNERKGAIDGG